MIDGKELSHFEWWRISLRAQVTNCRILIVTGISIIGLTVLFSGYAIVYSDLKDKLTLNLPQLQLS